MIIPVRCFTCGKVLAKTSIWNEYVRRVEEQEATGTSSSTSTSPNFDKNVRGKILDDIGLKKLCCRRIVLSHVDFD